MMKRVHVSITREGIYYLGMMGFIIAAAMIRDINLLYIMAGMMLGPMLFSIYAAGRSLRKLELQRRYSPLVAAGDPLHVEILAAKPMASPRGLAIVVRDSLHRDGDARRDVVPVDLFFEYVAAGKTVERAYCARLERRGKYKLGPLRASTGQPIGLVRAMASQSEPEFVLVSPRLGLLQPAWSRYLNLNLDGGQKTIRRRGKREGDFYSMREYREGDSRNWIHWRTSAKLGKLAVRQFQQRINQDVVLILDLIQPTQQGSHSGASNNPSGQDLAELAISFVATLLTDQGKQRSAQLTVAIAGRNGFVLRGIASPVFRREVMEGMAIIDTSPRDTLCDLLGDVLPRVSASAKVVLVSTTARDLSAGEALEKLWRRTDIRTTTNEIVQVDVGSDQFAELFRYDVRGPERSDRPEQTASPEVRETRL